MPPAELAEKARKDVVFSARILNPETWTAEYRIPLDLFSLSSPEKAKLECNVSVRKTAGPGWVMWQGTGGLTWETWKAGLLSF